MENAYGIGIANRYELFYVDEEAGNSTNKIIKKAKQQKKLAASASVAANGGAIEKENNSTNSNKTTTTTKAAPIKVVKNGAPNQNGQQQNNRNDRSPREGKDVKNVDRKNDVNNQNGENREQRYNRKNRENRENQPLNHDNNANVNNNRTGESRRQGGGNDRGPPNRRQFGKREFDRQSGSDKTGVKAIDKREGGGAHNWGTHKQDIDDFRKGQAGWDPENDGHKTKDEKETDDTTKLENGKDNGNEQANQVVEEEAKELTLDEWKAQRAVRAKPQFNIRKAGEGEDTSQWTKMIALESRKKKVQASGNAPGEDNSDDEYEYDPSMYPQRVGRQKHVLDIDIHFNDGPRGSLNRRRGRPRSQRQSNEGKTGPSANGNPERRRNQQSFRNRGPRKDDERRGQNAPKVDDEHHFPSLG